MELDHRLAALTLPVTALRRDLHAHPELAFAEQRTAAVIVTRLKELGIETHTGLAGTGVIGRVRAGAGNRSIGLRADMDALPISECNDFAHRSLYDGRMHACGHDGHVAMLLGAAEVLIDWAGRGAFDGTVHLIFQPAEEHEGGGRLMVEQGLFSRFPMDMVFGLHNWPGLLAGSISVTEGPVMAGTDRFDIVIIGRGGHAAMPHLSTDTVLAGAALVQGMQALVSRSIDPLDPVVLSVTRFQAGDTDNVLPERAVLGGTVRAFRPELQQALELGMRRVCDAVALAHGVRVELDYQRGYPPTVNAADPSALCRRAGRAAVGADRLFTDLKPSMGAEDFAYMSAVVPGCYAWIGNGSGEGGCLLHSPHYDFNDEIILDGVRYWLKLVELALPPQRT